MRIRRIFLRNFGSHVGTELSFSDGINAIIGENGAGKTTILEAISYALYPRSIRNQDNLIRSGSSGLRVELEFELDGHLYLIVRERKKGNESSALLYELLDGKRKLIQRDQSKVSKQVESLLGIGRETFLQAIYVKQGEIAGLLEQTPAKRKELIGKLLGIEALEGIWEELKNVISKLDTKIYSIESEMRGIGDVFKEEASLLGELERLKEDKMALEKQENDLGSKIDSLKKQLSTLEEVDRKYTSLRTREGNLLANIRQLTEEIRNKEEELTKIEEELTKMPELEELASEYDAISDIKEQISGLMRLRDRLSYLERRKNELDLYEREVASLDKLVEEEKSLENKISMLNSLKDRLIRLEERLKISERRASEIRNQIIEERNKLRNLLADLSSLIGLELDESSDVDRIITKEIRSLESRINELEASLSSLREERSKTNERIEHNKRYLDDLRGSIDKCPLCGSNLDRESVKRLRRKLLDEIKLLKVEYEDYDNKIKVLADRISEMKDRLKDLKSFNISEISRSKAKLEGDIKELSEVERDINGLNDLIEPLREKLTDLNELKLRINKLKSEISKKERLLPIIEEIRRELSEESIESLKEKVMGIEEEVKKRISALGLDERSLDEEYSRSLAAFKEMQRLKGLLSTRDSLKRDIDKMKGNLRSMSEELRLVREEISSLSYDPTTLRSMREELEDLEVSFNKAITEKNKLLGKIEELESRINQLGGKKKRLEELRTKREKLSRFRSKIIKVREVFSRDKGIQTLIRERAKPSIEEELNIIFSSFNFDYDSVYLDEDFTPYLRRGNSIFSFNRLSGGERVSLALALRLAIARYLMARVETFILDEPTIHLDEERINALIETISSLNVPQMIIVTHSARFRDIATHSILVSKSGNTSKIEVLDDEGHVSD